jgi:maltose alpha-D-glucosyltransferase/alpha-amylase
LPIDPDPARPNVADQENRPDATLNLVRRLIGLRKSTPALGSRAATRVLHDGYPFTFTRGETHVVVVNPRQEPAVVSAPEIVGATDVFSSGVTISNDQLTIEGFGYGVLARA